MRQNQAITFIKPHAVRSPEVMGVVLDIFRQHDIEVIIRRHVTGPDIARGNLVDRHYAANARRGTFENALALELKPEAQHAFQLAFDEPWDEAVRSGRVFSGDVARRKLGDLSCEELNTRWARYGAHKLSAGCYAAWFEAEGCYVINGFYPSVREQFTQPDAAIEILWVAFDLPWSVFRHDVVGSTNPAAADEQSIRGFLHDHAETFHLQVDSRDNILHASASPFEALCEAQIWLPPGESTRDPLWKRLRKKIPDTSEALVGKLLEWHASNPVVTLPDGQNGPLLDLLEDRNTAEVATILLHLLQTL